MLFASDSPITRSPSVKRFTSTCSTPSRADHSFSTTAGRRATVEHQRDATLELRDHFLGGPGVGLAGTVGARDRKTAAARRDEPPRERMVRHAKRHRAAPWGDQNDSEWTWPEALSEGARDRSDDGTRLEVPGIREQHGDALLLRTVFRAVELAHVLVSSR